MQAITLSSLSLIFQQGDTLIYEPRNVRASTTTAVDTFTSRLVGLEMFPFTQRASEPRRSHSASAAGRHEPNNALWQLQPETRSFRGKHVACDVDSYTIRKPASRSRIKFRIRSLQRTISFNAASDGLSADLTHNILVSVTPFSSTAKLTVDELRAGWLPELARILGKGIYDYSPTILQAENTESQIQAGQNPLSFDARISPALQRRTVRGLPRWSVRNIDVPGQQGQVSSATSRCDLWCSAS